MPSSHQYFSLPLPNRRTLRDESKRRKRRGTHPLVEEEDLTDGSEHTIPDGIRDGPIFKPLDAPPTSSFAVIDPESFEQYLVAGYSGHEPLPINFPHRSLATEAQGTKKDTQSTEAEPQRALSQLSPPLFVPYELHHTGSSISTYPPGLRIHHLSVLTTVMYRCLLEGDYSRAGRAWGMLLRTEARGKAIDPRGDGRWGIGAEILLREGLRSEMSQGRDESSDTEMGDADNPTAENRSMSGAWFTREGFSKAKEYYERLILQYPYDKRWPSKANSLHFYLVMFGLWIYVTEQEAKEGLARIARGLVEDIHSDQEHASPEAADAIRRKELLGAESIASRMDELMLSPPYLDSPDLWHLRGMVALWMADLCSSAMSASPDGEDQEMDDPAGNVYGTDLSRRDDELNRAKSAFRRVASTGGVLWEGVASLLHDREEITEDI